MRLGKVLRSWRLHEEMQLRETGALFGISAATLLRIESGHAPSGEVLGAILSWLVHHNGGGHKAAGHREQARRRKLAGGGR